MIFMYFLLLFDTHHASSPDCCPRAVFRCTKDKFFTYLFSFLTYLFLLLTHYHIKGSIYTYVCLTKRRILQHLHIILCHLIIKTDVCFQPFVCFTFLGHCPSLVNVKLFMVLVCIELCHSCYPDERQHFFVKTTFWDMLLFSFHSLDIIL